jgi:hypothetical protein
VSPQGGSYDEEAVTEEETEVFILVGAVGLLLGCLRDFRRSQDTADLDGALRLEPGVSEVLARVRERLPPAG